MLSKKSKVSLRSQRSRPALLLELDRESDQPLFRQIYSSIRAGILCGQLVPNLRLPASRTLAADLGVARATVVLAYEQLIVEGYLRGGGSSGTMVVPLTLPLPPRGPAEGRPVDHPIAIGAVEPSHTTPNVPRPFRIAEPALDLFPRNIWTRLAARRSRTSWSEVLGYGTANGFWPLRRAIATYVAASRGVRATPEQVVLVRGAQQAIDLVARVLLKPRDTVWFEDPGYPLARRILEQAGMEMAFIPVDQEGLCVEIGVRRAPDARLAYVAPSHQFPLGSVMSLERRLALLEWATRSDAWVVEDDYDSEFRYPGQPISSLQGLDGGARTIYVGTFSKTVFPALRLGYLVLPDTLLDRFGSTMAIIDHIAPSLEQAVLTDFIEEGHFTRHLRHMRSAYAERQQALLEAALQELPDLMTVAPGDAGMHAIGWLRDLDTDDRLISSRALARGIETQPLSQCCAQVVLPPALLLGFAAIRPHVMAPALRVLRSVLTEGRR